MKLHHVTRPRVLVPGIAVLAAAATVLAVLAVGGDRTAPSRNQRWRADITYLASELPHRHVGGLLQVRRPAWNGAAARLEARVPWLSDGQVIVGMARMVAMLHDDETQVLLPAGTSFPFRLTWAGGKLYLVSVPRAERDLLGAQILEVGGQTIAQVLSRIASVIDDQDPGLLQDEEAGYLRSFPPLLYWLGVTRSPDWAAFTVRAVDGVRSVLRLSAVTHVRAADLASIPQPLYLRDQDKPYWLQVLSSQRAVYLKYNECRNDNGFQQLAIRALAVLRRQPSYRLIVDLRDNSGGDTEPFTSLIGALTADPALHRRDRIFGLVNQYTDSSATLDAYNLGQVPNALLIGQPPGDPINEYGNESSFTLPNSGITVLYTTKVVNDPSRRLATPDIVVAPTIRQVLTGADPVLATALSYPPPGP
ncbi:MAG: S41 family peptidase [Actinomycetota bacterium]|nr:S41 family peptidase [Actinomycetota bacterium]